MLLINAVNAAGRPVELFVKDGKIPLAVIKISFQHQASV